MSRQHPPRVLQRLAVGVGLALAASVTLAMPANAVGTGDIDPATPVSLTVHKYEQPQTGDLGANDGSQIAPVGNALDGVEFTVQRVTNVDLSQNAGWETADSLTADEVLAPGSGYVLGTAVTGTTATTEAGPGSIIFTDAQLDGIGLYLVQETNPGANPIAAPAVPFLVALPLPTGDGTWNYTPHVYPKNALSTITKKADDSDDFVVGDVVDWTVRSGVPTLSQGVEYTQYAIGDRFDAALDYQSVVVTLADGTRTPLTEGTHYTVTATDVAGEDAVLVDFLPEGLALLNAASPTAQVEAVFATAVLGVDDDGSIENVAHVFINDAFITDDGTGKPYVPGEPYDPDGPAGPLAPVDPSSPDYPGAPSNEAVTNWSQLRIVKHAEGDESQLLEGALFDVYADADGDGAMDATPVATGLATDVNGVHLVTLKVGTYWLVETQAPAGYQLVTTPIEVAVTQGAVTDSAVEMLVPNPQVPVYELPLTGGSGAAAFTIGGAGLILLAGGAYLVMRRRAHRAEA